MLSVPVVDMQGNAAGQMEIDPKVLGGEVRPKLLKQAIVGFLSNQRQGSARTKSRGMVRGSTRKIYRQKGTGNARMGANRTCVRRGGGVAFAKQNQNWTKKMPRKMRRLARNNAILAKITSEDAIIIKGMAFQEPKTKLFATMLKAIGADKGVILALHEYNETVYRSGRNVPTADIREVGQLCAYEILRRKKLVFTEEAFEAFRSDPVSVRFGSPEDGIE